MAPIDPHSEHSISALFSLPWLKMLLFVGECLVHCAALSALAGVLAYLILQIPVVRRLCCKEGGVPGRAVYFPEKDCKKTLAAPEGAVGDTVQAETA